MDRQAVAAARPGGPLELDASYAAAVNSLAQRAGVVGKYRAAAAAVLLVVADAALLFFALDGPKTAFPVMIGFSIFITGALVVGIIRPGLIANESLRQRLFSLDPREWFVSPSHAMVVVSDAGIFVHRLGSIPFDSLAAKWLTSASYDEDRHALILQVMHRYRHKQVEQETVSRHPVKLPEDFTPARALELSMMLNRAMHSRRH